MGRLGNLLSWELNDHVKVLVALVGLLVSGFVFQRELTTVVVQIGTVSRHSSGLSSLTGMVLLKAVTSPEFWIPALFFVVILVALTFRSGLEKGYEAIVYSLPYSKPEVFSMKFLASLILSSIVVFLPLLVLPSVNLSSTPHFLSSLFLGKRFLGLFIDVFGALLYVVSLTVLLAEILRNMLAVLIFAFPLVMMPYLLNLKLPPRILFSKLFLLRGPNFSLHGFLIRSGFPIYGLALPGLFISVSLILVLRRDVG